MSKYKVTIIKVNEDSQDIMDVYTEKIPFKVKWTEEGEETEYGTKDLYEVKTNPFSRLYYRLFKKREKAFMIVVDKNNEPFKEVEPKISGKVLKVAKEWKGLDKAIKSAFSTPFELPRWGILVLVLLALGVLVGLIRSGYIPVPEGFPI